MFNFFYYYRKILYSLFIVYLHDYQYIQLMMIAGLNYALVILLFKIKPYKEKSQSNIMIVTEILLSFTAISIAGFQFFQQYYFIAGWIIIGATSSIILIHFSIIIKGLVGTFKMIFLKNNSDIEAKRRVAHSGGIHNQNYNELETGRKYKIKGLTKIVEDLDLE